MAIEHHLSQVHALCAKVQATDTIAAQAAQNRLDSLTKPRGSLGHIENLIVRLAASTGHVCPTFARRAVLLAAADHGVAAEGVSAYPQAVTAQMVGNFLSGGAAINALAAEADARILLVDAGVVGDIPHLDSYPVVFHRLNIRRGSGNIAHEPAMTTTEAIDALLAGATIVHEAQASTGLDVLALGEMGIANTTPTAALVSAFTGAAPAETVGRGTGIDDSTLQHKRDIVTKALQRFQHMHETHTTTYPHHTGAPNITSALTTLCELGGLEIAVLAGATIAAAAQRIPVLLDGYITTSAALVAVAMASNVQHHLIASHCSAEPGHVLALEHLGLTTEHNAAPLLNLDLRLGEGSGAMLAMPLLISASRLMRDMATFEQAGVANRDAT